MHQVAMSHARPGIKSGLKQLWVGQPSNQLLGGNLIDENLIGARASSKLALWSQRHRINRVQPLRQRLPNNRSRAMNLAFGAFIYPELDESQLFRRQVRRFDFV